MLPAGQAGDLLEGLHQAVVDSVKDVPTTQADLLRSRRCPVILVEGAALDVDGVVEGERIFELRRDHADPFELPRLIRCVVGAVGRRFDRDRAESETGQQSQAGNTHTRSSRRNWTVADAVLPASGLFRRVQVRLSGLRAIVASGWRDCTAA